MGDDPRRPENNRFERNVIAYSRDDFRGLSTAKPGSNTAVVYDFDQFDPASTPQSAATSFIIPDRTCAWPGASYKEEGRATLTWAEWQEKGFDAESMLADPRFYAPEEDDYRLRKDSPAFALGFEEIPEEQIGLYPDEFRASWPPPAEERKNGMDHEEFPVNLE